MSQQVADPDFTSTHPDSKMILDFSLQIKNMHLWRGYEVTSQAMSAVDLSVSTRNNMFKAGI
ncbi:MAG: hypothetical protein LIO65_04360 [Odoribacter sp.]|nr:hypothetical protein [Odoribacter sp.]